MKSGDVTVRNYNLIQRYKGLPQAQPHEAFLDTAHAYDGVIINPCEQIHHWRNTFTNIYSNEIQEAN
jgi:hypothetical protein